MRKAFSLWVFLAVFIPGALLGWLVSYQITSLTKENEENRFDHLGDQIRVQTEKELQSVEQALSFVRSIFDQRYRDKTKSGTAYFSHIFSELKDRGDFNTVRGLVLVDIAKPADPQLVSAVFLDSQMDKLLEVIRGEEVLRIMSKSHQDKSEIYSQKIPELKNEKHGSPMFLFSSIGSLDDHTVVGLLFYPERLILDTFKQMNQDHIGMKVYEGSSAHPDRLIAKIIDEEKVAKSKGRYHYWTTMNRKGLDWSFYFSCYDSFYSPTTQYLPTLFFFVVCLLALFLALFAQSVSTTKVRAVRLAEQMTSELNFKQEELQTVVNSIPGKISWVDRNLVYRGVNLEMAVELGQSPEDFIGKPLGWSESEDKKKEILRAVEAFISSDLRRKTDYIVVGEDPDEASTKHYILSLQKYNNDKLIMIVTIDVTSQKQLEREVEVTKEKALHSSRMSALGEMAGGMAHEINNPLSVIYAKASFTKMELQRNGTNANFEVIVEAMSKIESTADRISKIIKGLRTIARDGENDPFTISSVRSIVTDTIELCKHRLKNNDVKFEYPELDREIYLECRPTQIIQVLLNLIGNGHDAISGLEEKWVRLEIKDDESSIEFSVTDSGKGIPLEIAEKLMQPFFTTKEVGKGTGLGLSISKGIAQSHRGSLKVDPTSVNTRFILIIPKRQTQQGAA